MFYIAAFLIVAGVALFVAAPLTGGLARRRTASRDELESAQWEHEQALAVQGLRELEFDREMGKLSDGDYASLQAALEARALAAITAIEWLKDKERAATLAALEAWSRRRPTAPAAEQTQQRPGPVPAGPPAVQPAQPSTAAASAPRWTSPEASAGRRARFCPQCGMRAPASGNFCGECGAPVRGERIATRAS